MYTHTRHVPAYYQPPVFAYQMQPARSSGTGWLVFGAFLAMIYVGAILPLCLFLYFSRPAETITFSDNVAAVAIAIFLSLPVAAAFGMYSLKRRQARQL